MKKEELFQKYITDTLVHEEWVMLLELLREDEKNAIQLGQFIEDCSLMIDIGQKIESYKTGRNLEPVDIANFEFPEEIADKPKRKPVKTTRLETIRLNNKEAISKLARKSQKSKKTSKESSSPMKWALLSTLAACFVFGMAIMFYKRPVAKIISFEGSFSIERKGVKISGYEGMSIKDGDIIVTNKGKMTYKYPDGTKVITYPHTRMKIKDNWGAKHIFMKHGKILADVEKQPEGKAMKVHYSKSTATVLGTILRVIGKDKKFRLDVKEGTVKLENPAGETAYVRENEFSVAESGREMTVNKVDSRDRIYLGSWNLKKGENSFEMDATGVVGLNGIYRIHLDYNSHKKGIYVTAAEIRSNNELLVRDSHAGSQCNCKFHENKPYYTVDVNNASFDKDIKLKLKFEVKTPGPSKGRVYIERVGKKGSIHRIGSAIRNFLVDKEGYAYRKKVETLKYIVVHYNTLWATTPKSELDRMKAFYKENKNRYNFEIVHHSWDASKEDMETYLKQNKIPWPSLRYDKRLQTKLMEVSTGVPSMIILDRDGAIVGRSLDDLAKLVKRVPVTTP